MHVMLLFNLLFFSRSCAVCAVRNTRHCTGKVTIAAPVVFVCKTVSSSLSNTHCRRSFAAALVQSDRNSR